MTNLEKYNNIFTSVFSVEESVLGENFVYQCIPAWDSIGHMGMIAEIEDQFDIMMDTDDIIDFSSYEKGKEILEKYEVKF